MTEKELKTITEMTEAELKAIAEQLSCPTGDSGLEMAERMNRTNSGMIFSTIEHLDIRENDHILELGHGNASHLNEIVKKAEGLKYNGLEISDTMKRESEKVNTHFVENQQAEFTTYDGLSIPFPESTFDKIMTVNTLYFWQKPFELLKEIHRVIKDKGVVCITFATMDFMKNLPFVDERFELYDIHKFKTLASSLSFSAIDAISKEEIVQSKAGETVTRTYTVMRLTK